MSSRRKNVEDAIQRELIRWLRLQHSDWKVFATRNEDSRKRSKEIEAGMPDLILRKEIDGIRHIIWFEVKTQKGTLQKNQIEWAESQNFCKNEQYDVGYGLDQCIEKLNELTKG